jgi:hypothetical protein
MSANVPEVFGDFVSDHLLQSEPKQVGGITAVRACDNIATVACCTAGPAVAASARVHKTCTDDGLGGNVAAPVGLPWSKALCHGEFALKELAPAANGARRVPLDEVDRRVWCVLISLSRTDLLLKRKCDPPPGGIGGLGLIRELRAEM